ncbi:MAG: hypothetical protein RI885_21 [Actinomycetota bacterium]|jgi:ABC-type transport system involved in multi-copper enzyme maturation permease subunit
MTSTLETSATPTTPRPPNSGRALDFFSGVGVIFMLELRQRVRGVAWYVLLGVFVGLIAIVTVLLTVSLGAFGGDAGGGTFSTIIYFVLLLGTLVAPALSGNAINGDREAGTLATTQVTLVTTGELVVGKFLAAWVTALAFLVSAVPFLAFSSFMGGLSIGSMIVSIAVLAFELGVVAAVGVGLSGIIVRPLFSIVVSYLVVAALSVGSLIAFTLGGIAVQSEVTATTIAGATYDDQTGEPTSCSAPQVNTYPVPRFDYFWGVLVANPYVLLADAVPTEYDSQGNAQDLFGFIKVGVRSAQIPPELTTSFDECDSATYEDDFPSARETIESTVPGWFVGVIIHLALAIAALVGAWARTRTPAARLSRGSRIA